MPRTPKPKPKPRTVNAIPRRANPRIDLKTGKRGAPKPKTRRNPPTDQIRVGTQLRSRMPRKNATPIPTIKPKKRAPNVKNRNRSNRNQKA